MNVFARNSSLLAATVAAIGLAGHAQSAPPSQARAIPLNGAVQTFVPRGLDTTPTTVVVVLGGEPVAVVQRNLGRELNRSERDSVIAARRSDHTTLMPEISRRGGHVLAHFQSALNGIKVRIARNQVDSLRTMPGVVAVKPVGLYTLNNAVSVPFIGSPQAWQLAQQYQGQGVKIAIVDTGIDYTHANFGGPGTVAAFQAAAASSTSAADPALFGPNAPKVKGGTDLVGDNYDAAAAAGSPKLIAHPDSNPLDCGGHGSHVAGTAAGFGVKADGTAFTGPYSAAAYSANAFRIGPGVAPRADLYAVRVFGCSGSTDVVTEAIDWAVANGMNVISMSLGSNYGAADNADALAVANANAAGILVIAASGNAGPTPYITSSPASSDGAISVAATDSSAGFPAASLALPGGSTITVQDSNGAAFTNNTNYPIVVLRNPPVPPATIGAISLGCTEAEYDKARNGGIDITGRLVVTLRGSCARVYRAGAGQKYGAAAVAMINTAPGYPAYEGPIPGGDPATNPFAPVTIPFFGVLAADAAKLSSAASAAATKGLLANPGYSIAASFSSGGPRWGDSALRPGVTAPGVATVSTGVGTGNGAATMSGTSMATPHVAGLAALVKQAYPTWSVSDLRSAVLQTAAPAKLLDYAPRLEGAGLVQSLAAVSTQAVVRTPNDSVSFGYADLLHDFSATRQLTVHNDGAKAVQFNISVTPAAGSLPATVTVAPSVIVNAKSDAVFSVKLDVAAAAVGGTHAPDGSTPFHDVAGTIRLTPSSSRLNNGVTLTVPYYLVARTRSNLSTSATTLLGLPAGANNLVVSNSGGALAAEPDFYSLGQIAAAPQGVAYADARAIGVQAWPDGAGDSFMVFAINTFGRFSNAAGWLEWDIFIDTTGTGGAPDYVLVGGRGGWFTSTASLAETPVSALIKLSTGAVTALYYADTATDNSTVLLPVYASDMGMTAANPRITYYLNSFGPDGSGAAMPGGRGRFNAFTPALNVSGTGSIAPGGSAAATVGVNPVEWAITPAKGLMIVAPDNLSGINQARILTVN